MSGPSTGLEGGAHRLTNWKDIPISVHWTFWFNFVFQIIVTVLNKSFQSSWKYILLIVILWGPLLLFIVYLHELGHLYANRKYGGNCSGSVLWPLGGFSATHIPLCTCMQEFYVALAGPLTHIPKFFLWLLIMSLASENGIDYYKLQFNINEFNNGGADEWFAKLAKEALNIEMLIFFLNILVPAYPLDASRIVAAVCVQCGMSVDRACLTLIIIGGAMGLGSTIFGIIELINGGDFGLLLLLLGLFLLSTTWNLFKYYNLKRVTQHPVFQADCYSERRTYAAGESGPSRNYTDGRANQGDRKKTAKTKKKNSKKNNNNDVEMQRKPQSKKKLTYGQALVKAEKMKLGPLKTECRKAGVNTTGFMEKSEFEQAYAKYLCGK